MSSANSKSTRRSTRSRASPGADEAAARGKRARDHLARKRLQERRRLERQRARAESSTSRAQLRGVIAPILFASAFLIGIAAAPLLAELILLRTVTLERIAVQGASTLTPLAIAAGAGVAAGRSLDSIDPTEVRELLATHPWIESARALRLPTGTLIISVVERQALARWQFDDARAIELIDHRGDRFAGATEPGGPLPLVRGVAGGADSLPASAIEILDEMQRYASLSASPDGMTLHLPDGNPSAVDEESGYVLQIGEGGPRALLGQRLLTQRIARLAALLESDASALRDTRWIDLRYADRAVLRTAPVSG